MNITVVQAYAPTSDYADNEIEGFYDQLQNVIDQTPKKTGMQKWAGMFVETGKAFVDPSAMMTQMREDSDFWSSLPLTILCWRAHLVITNHPEDGHGLAPQPD